MELNQQASLKKKGRKNFGAKENKASSPKKKKKKEKSCLCIYVCDEWSTKKGERDARKEHVYVQSYSLGI